MQNDILRTCFNVKLFDRLSLVDMYREASLVSLEQQRSIELLGLMNIYKNCQNVECIFARNTGQGARYHFKTFQSGKYKNSPCFKGMLLLNSLPDNVILLPILAEFKV